MPVVIKLLHIGILVCSFGNCYGKYKIKNNTVGRRRPSA